MRIKLVAVALLSVAAGAQPALAAVTAPVIVGAYYEQNGNAYCGASSSSSSGASGGPVSASSCRIDFTLPPAGKLLAISNVSCSLIADSAPLTDLYLTVTKSGVDGRIHRLNPTLKTQQGAYSFYLLDDNLEYLVANGPSVVMRDSDYGGLNMECQIVGALVNKP